VYYCCGFATEFGTQALQASGVAVKITPAYRLTTRDGLLSSDTRLLKPAVRDEVQEMIARVSRDIGLPDTGGTQPEDWRGFAGLGLAIADENSTPDATLPLFYTERNDWKWLVKRK